MRIFLTIPGSTNPAYPSGLWRANLHDPLVTMGHDVVLHERDVLPMFDLDPAAPATREPRARFSERWRHALDEANAVARVDLVFTYVSGSHLEPEAIRAARRDVAPVVNFFCNNIHQFHLVRPVVGAFDLNLVPELEALARYRAVGAEAIYWPMAANPEVYRRLDLPVRFDATFSGQRYGDRTALVLALREAGVDAHAFGQGWATAADRAAATGTVPPGRGGLAADLGRLVVDTAHGRLPWRSIGDRIARQRLVTRHAAALHPPVGDEEYVALFSTSRISLGFLGLGDTHRTLRPLRQVRLREFEAPMAGGFYLTGWVPELAGLYDVGREIECYRSTVELVDKARFYLRDEVARERVRRAGYERAHRDHTWTRRFETLFAELERRGLRRVA